jgi:hypothetical protein
VARETAERRASIIAVPTVRETITPLQLSAGTQLPRKASMASLGAVVAPSLTRKPSCSALTLDQLLFSSATVTGGASSSETTHGEKDKEREREKNFPVSRGAKARKRVPGTGAESAAAAPIYSGKRRGSDSSQSSSAGVGIGVYPFLGGGERERNSTPLQALRERDAPDDDNDDAYNGIAAADKILKANYEPQDQ